jgi:cell division topological specificity factor
MSIFTDIYNTVAKFFRQSDEPVIGEASKAVAANRLKLVLMQDRTNLTPKVLEQMRGEMIDLLSKYLEMDKDMLELNFEQEGDQVALMLSIPVIRAKDEDEIEAATQNSEDLSDEDNTEDADFEQNTDENREENETEQAVKPKKRRSKKVTPPEDFEGCAEEITTEFNEAECSSASQEEQNEICENTEA